MSKFSVIRAGTFTHEGVETAFFEITPRSGVAGVLAQWTTGADSQEDLYVGTGEQESSAYGVFRRIEIAEQGYRVELSRSLGQLPAIFVLIVEPAAMTGCAEAYEALSRFNT